MGKKTLKPSTLLLPCPVGLITTQGKDGKPNIITLAWIGNIASEPPMVSISIRPSRYSHKLLIENKDFVINIPSANDLEKVDFCGMVSGNDIDKFKETDFTFKPAGHVKAPIIIECPVNLECKTKYVLHLGTHDVFLAEVISVQVNNEVLDKDEKWQIANINPLVYCPPTREYWTLGKAVGHYGFGQGEIKK